MIYKLYFYNAETGKYTVSMSYLCKTLLKKEETHKAYDDVIDTNHCLQKVFQQIPEIQGLIEYVSDNDNRDILFESPLLKIKNDLIKFLLNLNIVISNEEKSDKNLERIEENKSEKKVGRNEKCPCGSGKKFKHCHGNV